MVVNMPYIPEEKRGFGTLLSPKNRGELNYAITTLCKEYIARAGERYENYDAVIGTLECVKLELYRRRIAAYEDKKIKENGDVF